MLENKKIVLLDTKRSNRSNFSKLFPPTKHIDLNGNIKYILYSWDIQLFNNTKTNTVKLHIK